MDTGAGMKMFDSPVTVANVVADADAHESGVQVHPSYGQENTKYQVRQGGRRAYPQYKKSGAQLERFVFYIDRVPFHISCEYTCWVLEYISKIVRDPR